VEYAVLIGIVTAALVTMQTYIKRGVQAGIKVAADQIGDQRRGLMERDRNRNWIVKEESRITTDTPPSTSSVELRPDGVTVYRTAQMASGSGRSSFTLSAERDQNSD
jgi:Flp pilus assembly pilin Flp